MRQAPIRRALFLSVGGYTWTGATWALSGGRAFNTPTLGSELVANNGFDSDTIWFKEAGWTIGSGVASHTGAISAIYQAVLTSGQWHRIDFDVSAYTSGNVYMLMGGSTLGPNRTAIGSYVQTGRSAGAGAGAGSTGTASVDNITAKRITLSTIPATVVGIAGQTVTAKPYAITNGTQSGVISHLDSAASPANFIIAYHDGTGVTLDKCVGGTWSNVIPRVTVAFASDAVIEIRRPSGNTFQLWYGGTQRGTDQTISDAGIISNTRYGLFSTYSANTFSDGLTLDGVLIPFRF